MGLGKLRGMMWAGIMDGHIATDHKSTDEYTPLSVALFSSKAEARRHYECVIQIDADAMFRVEDETPSVRS